MWEIKWEDPSFGNENKFKVFDNYHEIFDNWQIFFLALSLCEFLFHLQQVFTFLEFSFIVAIAAVSKPETRIVIVKAKNY